MWQVRKHWGEGHRVRKVIGEEKVVRILRE